VEKIKNCTGIRKYLFSMKIKIHVFFYFFLELYKGRITIKNFFLILKRLLYFLEKLKHNKFVKIGKNTRLDLYIPGFPSRGFYTALKKFSVFDSKLPNTTVLISLTKACRYRCVHCYQRNDKGKDLPLEKLIPVVKQLQDMGVAFINIEGGEPFLVYEKLKDICEVIDERSEIWINSTGDGMTAQKCSELKKSGITGIMFSLHSIVPEEFDAFMGYKGAWDKLVRGIEICHKEDIPVSFNVCLNPESFYNGIFEKIMERVKSYKAAIVQLIKPKPAGAWLDGDGACVFTKKDLQYVKKLVNKYNRNPAYRNYPSISAQICEEDPEMFGCTAGGTDRFYINAKGDVQPCEFLNISFGNIGKENFDSIYRRMRKIFKKPGECWLCESYSKDVLKLMKRHNITTLPLDMEFSEQIYNKWDRGKQTELYRRIEEEYI